MIHLESKASSNASNAGFMDGSGPDSGIVGNAQHAMARACGRGMIAGVVLVVSPSLAQGGAETLDRETVLAGRQTKRHRLPAFNSNRLIV